MNDLCIERNLAMGVKLTLDALTNDQLCKFYNLAIWDGVDLKKQLDAEIFDIVKPLLDCEIGHWRLRPDLSIAVDRIISERLS